MTRRRRGRRKTTAAPATDAPRSDATDGLFQTFEQLLVRAGVSADDRPAIHRELLVLRGEQPRATPARLIGLARMRGAPIPPSYCNHGIQRGECVVCDPELRNRYYLTGGGSHFHRIPGCKALAAGQAKVVARGGQPEPIEVLHLLSGPGGWRDPCMTCFPFGTVRVTGSSQAPVLDPFVPRAGDHSRLGFAVLAQNNSPELGSAIEWAGYSGEVVSTGGEGVRMASGAYNFIVPWGETIRVVVH